MSLARLKTWLLGEVLTAEDLNAEFNNVLNHPISLISPVTASINMDGWPLQNAIYAHTFVAFAAGDTTPSVSSGTMFKTANSTATTITMFDGGTEGQMIWVWITDVHTVFDFTATNLKGNAGADWSPAVGDSLQAVFTGSYWVCRISKNV